MKVLTINEAIEFKSSTRVCGRLLWGHVKAQSCVFHRCIFYGDLLLEGSGNVFSCCIVIGTLYVILP